MNGTHSAHTNQRSNTPSPASMASSDDLPPLAGSAADSDALPSMGAFTDASPSPPSISVSATSTGAAPLASPSTHAERPHPVIVHSKMIKGRTESGTKTLNGRILMHALGEGATAEVTLCADPETGEHYALKKMSKRALSKHKEYGQGPMGRPKITTGLDKVRREIALMSQVWHKHVLVLEALIDDPDEDALILVLEYAAQGQICNFDSKTLRYKSNMGGANAAATNGAGDDVAAAASSSSSAASAATPASPFSESIVRKVLLDVVSGLEYLHSLRIIHRDIKPDNLLLSSNGDVKIADLGVARQFAEGESTRISETHGTYHFFSPEMCSGDMDTYDPFGADIWALGVCGYILASGGRVPFLSASNNPQELFTMIAEHKKGSLDWSGADGVSDACKDLIESIMDPNPDTRLSFDQIRAHPFMQHAQEDLLSHALDRMKVASPILVPDA